MVSSYITPELQSLFSKIEELGEEMLQITDTWCFKTPETEKIKAAKVRGIILPHEAAEQILTKAVFEQITTFKNIQRFYDLGSIVETLVVEATERMNALND